MAYGSKVIATAHLQHSQSISQAKIRQWFTAEQSGNIACMAGLGEACSHISHSAPAAETHTCLVKNTACSSLPCGWLPPTLKNVTASAMSTDCSAANHGLIWLVILSVSVVYEILSQR